MKLLKNMTTEEICELTEEQLDRRVKLECAEQGIQLMPPPPTIEAFDIAKSVTGYKVCGLDYVFQDIEAAKDVLAALEKHQHKLFKSTYDYRLGYDVEWLEQSENDLKIETKMFFDHNIVRQREDFLVKRKTLKSEYESAKKLYEDSRDKMRRIADGVYSEYYEAKTILRKTEEAKKMFAEYVDLADGDRAKAKVFFDKALKESLPEDVYNAAIAKATGEEG